MAQREQADVVRSTERVWSTPGPAAADDEERADDVVAIVRIPRLGAEYAVPAYAGSSDEVLTRGFGVMGSSPAPGGEGNLVLAGHRITHGEPMRRMQELRPGDVVQVETRDAVHTCTLDTAGDALTVGMDEGWVTAARPVDPRTGDSPAGLSDDRRLLTLVTCAELFHTDDRPLAFGHLTGVERR